MGKGKKLCVLLLSAAAIAACSVPARAGAVSEKRKAQNKLLAQRAARADAIRKLAERIRGLNITSETTVRDFVTESDRIETSMIAFLSGMKELGRPRHMEDGTCEVTLQVKLEEIIVALKSFHKRFYKGSRVQYADFDKMTVTNKIKILKETGMGAPREDLQEDPTVPVGEAAIDSFTYLRGPAKAYWLAHCRPQGRLMAVRAARVVGLRRLGERIGGVFITSETTVRDFVAESDQVNVDLRTFLRGAKERGIRYHDSELIVEVDMQVTLRELLMTLKTWAQRHYRGSRVQITQFDKLIVEARDKVIRETGMGVPPEKYLKQVPPEVQAVMALGQNVPPWVTRELRATGNAAVDTNNPNAAQAKLMAFRAAELDARRKLSERINGLRITSRTTVADFVAQNDRIRTGMLAFQQGGHVVEGSQKLAADGTAQAIVEIDPRPLWNMILYYQRTLKIRIR